MDGWFGVGSNRTTSDRRIRVTRIPTRNDRVWQSNENEDTRDSKIAIAAHFWLLLFTVLSCKFHTTTQVVHEKMRLKNETCPMMWVSTVSLLNLVTPYYFSIGCCCIVNYHGPCKNGFVPRNVWGLYRWWRSMSTDQEKQQLQYVKAPGHRGVIEREIRMVEKIK